MRGHLVVFMADNLPANVQPTDAAAAFPTEQRPALNEVETTTHNCEKALAIGNGDADEMQASGEWIQSTHFVSPKR